MTPQFTYLLIVSTVACISLIVDGFALFYFRWRYKL